MIDALSKNISPPSTCVSYRKQDKTLPEKITWPTTQSPAQARSAIEFSSSKSEFIQYTKQQENISWRLSLTSMYSEPLRCSYRTKTNI